MMRRRRKSHGGEKTDTTGTEGGIVIAARILTIDTTDDDALIRDREAHDVAMIQEKIGTGDAETIVEMTVRDEDATIQRTENLDVSTALVMSDHATSAPAKVEGISEEVTPTLATGGPDTTKKTIKPRRKSGSASWPPCSLQQQSLTKIAQSVLRHWNNRRQHFAKQTTRLESVEVIAASSTSCINKQATRALRTVWADRVVDIKGTKIRNGFYIGRPLLSCTITF